MHDRPQRQRALPALPEADDRVRGRPLLVVRERRVPLLGRAPHVQGDRGRPEAALPGRPQHPGAGIMAPLTCELWDLSGAPLLRTECATENGKPPLMIAFRPVAEPDVPPRHF